MQENILYSFRRCPYAMRARLAICIAQQSLTLREITLKDKPNSMLEYSPKGTVPVLVLSNKEVIDESLDIMIWALEKNDPEGYLDASKVHDMRTLIAENDGTFKRTLDRYKYADRFPENSQIEYRSQGESFLSQLEERLESHQFLFSDQACLADIAIFPFIRQFAHVDLAWFENSQYTQLNRWLADYKKSSIFLQVMTKYAVWKEDDTPIIFPTNNILV
jgi:glutathione S-transferase